MKEDKKMANAKLGALVVAGLVFLVFSLYMIGKNQNIFGSSVIVIAEVPEVNGLLPGNNVRFKGMDVGTVKEIEMITDSTIHIKMLIHKSMVSFILDNSKTTINSDGLMGNKIIQIHPQEGSASPVKAGDILFPLSQFKPEDLLLRLDSSGDVLEKILNNLAEITEKLNQSKAVWDLLSDPTLSADIKGSISEFKKAGIHAAALAKDGREMIRTFKDAKGMVNEIFVDTLNAQRFENSLIQLEKASLETALLMESLKETVSKIEAGEGTAGLILADSAFRAQMQKTMLNLEKSTENLNQNMEAMKSNFLFRGYFKDQEKAKKKAQKEADNK
ncbi:MlaD family protein [Algoriphagus sp. AK58]|uniref:MlaD family protein n=1 Tax=Algoriphagus sp. AK58 TaxID=1406877 RepID=UPI001650C0C8|nr:MlaD family protein [Algoriphagus sp. AK58]MBC6366039.1 MCE family protein [Algoriphagus sp. AK58]